jgi:KDO2-lipid IV(A) lauroyltransferase
MINEINYYLLKTFVFFIAHIPRKIGLKFFGFIGYIWYLTDTKRKKKAFKNISTKLDKNLTKTEINQFIKENFSHFCKSIFEVLWGTSINLDDYHKWFELEGLDHLKKAKQKNKGIFLITGHFGIWEFGIHSLEKEKLNWHSVYQPIKYAALDRFVKEVRLRFKTAHLLPINNALKGIVKAFKNNELVVLIIDKRVKPEKGVVVNFFGSRIIVNKNIARLALQTGAPVLPVFVVRHKNKFKTVLRPEIEVVKTGDDIKDIERTAQQFITAIEDMIREYPEQYPWYYNRWKPRPYSRLPNTTKS